MGPKVFQARRLKVLERENSRLNKAVAQLTLDTVMLKEAQVLIERWRMEYNTFRPCSSSNYRPPAPEAMLRHGSYRTKEETLSLCQEEKSLYL